MIDLAQLDKIRSKLPPEVKLVAVSKFKSPDAIKEAYNAGILDFGENRPQELKVKSELLPADIRWHFIGHLQTNKIKMIIDKVYLIHSIDSIKLLRAVNKEASKRDIVVNCLLQVYIASEESKQGMSEEEVAEVCSCQDQYENVRICGLMGMASFTDNKQKVGGEFRSLKTFFDLIKDKYFKENNLFSELSIGMSGDYLIAVENGATMVRIGSLIFGARDV
jgi:pyridoxal phosphate enzyme (YggS family)